MRTFKFQAGQTMIEVLAALSAAVIVVFAITVAVISALSNVQYSKSQNLATQYAQEGMEVLRQKRTTDWNTFNTYSGEYCLCKDSTDIEPKSGLYCSVNCPSDTVFYREIDFEDVPCSGIDSVNQVKATVTVIWSDGKCNDPGDVYCHNVSLVSCFSDFSVAPTL